MINESLCPQEGLNFLHKTALIFSLNSPKNEYNFKSSRNNKLLLLYLNKWSYFLLRKAVTDKVEFQMHQDVLRPTESNSKGIVLYHSKYNTEAGKHNK